MQLPPNPEISISKLSAVFNSTSATYKFYWFLSILAAVEKDKRRIDKIELFATMISLSWYTINYFHISFGKQDKLQQSIEQIKMIEKITVDDPKSDIAKRLLNSKNKQTISLLTHFDKNVPHKFLSPWLGTGNRSEIYSLSSTNLDQPPYSLLQNEIIIHERWFEYFKKNLGILKSFCHWNLTLFLQARNPNVPDIPSKIERPPIRKSLSAHKLKFWDIVILKLGELNCIYTGKKLEIGGYAVEHFIPFQFVAHDLMWNLIPADSSFNSKKGDKLPDFEKYFDTFFEIQKEGFKIIKYHDPKNKFLQDYLPIFPNLSLDRNRYADTLRPMLTIAHNNGFEYFNI